MVWMLYRGNTASDSKYFPAGCTAGAGRGSCLRDCRYSSGIPTSSISTQSGSTRRGLRQKSAKSLKSPMSSVPAGCWTNGLFPRSAWKKKAYLHLLAASVIRRAAALHFTSEEELNNSLIMGSEDRGFVIPTACHCRFFKTSRDHIFFAGAFRSWKTNGSCCSWAGSITKNSLSRQ